ncbi:hypothetical protein F5Y19DRAFT_112339 [Xylariaceae sp. FL1651]|nr:hypothetical protein F5Y19DRAFT_112339 [Xylariaceae sp. FL1651]
MAALGHADEQAESPFFQKLPAEIRLLIYTECWRISGLTQHLFADRHQSHIRRSSPCVVEHDAPDAYIDWINDPDAADIMRRSNTHSSQVLNPIMFSWRNHWPCQILAYGKEHQEGNTFLPLLLCSKRTYLECRASIVDSVTFVFHNWTTTVLLLRRNPLPIIQDIRRLQVSIDFSHLELTNSGIHDQANCCEWHVMCNLLADLPRLEELSIRFELGNSLQWDRFLMSGLYSCIPERLAKVTTINLPIDEDEEYEGLENASLDSHRDQGPAPPGVRLIRRGNPHLERFRRPPHNFDNIYNEHRRIRCSRGRVRTSTWVWVLQGTILCLCFFPMVVIVSGQRIRKQIRKRQR